MELRTPSIDEYDDVLALWDACGITYRPEGRDASAHIEAELAADPDYWIAAYEDDVLVGIVVGTDDGRKGWVNRLAVHPTFQGKGIATRLLAALEAAFEERGLQVFAALVEAGNVASAAFFEDAGYEASQTTYYSKQENERV